MRIIHRMQPENVSRTSARDFLHWVNIIRNKHVFCSVPRKCEIYYNMTKNGTDIDAMNRDSSSDSNNTEENKADAIEVLKRNNITRTQFAESDCSSGRFRLDCTDCEAILICVRCCSTRLQCERIYTLKVNTKKVKQFNLTNT